MAYTRSRTYARTRSTRVRTLAHVAHALAQTSLASVGNTLMMFWTVPILWTGSLGHACSNFVMIDRPHVAVENLTSTRICGKLWPACVSAMPEAQDEPNLGRGAYDTHASACKPKPQRLSFMDQCRAIKWVDNTATVALCTQVFFHRWEQDFLLHGYKAIYSCPALSDRDWSQNLVG